MERTPLEAEQKALQDRLAVLCGHRNAVDAQLVDTIADSLVTGSWFMWGVQSPEHFVAWQTGSSSSHARHVVAVARRRDELPCTYALFQAGELSLDQMTVVAAHAPSWADAEVAPLAKHATVSQLRHVLRRYPWPDDAEPEPGPPAPAAAPPPHDFYSLTFDERGRFRLVAEGDATDGALIDNAINEAHDRLFRESHPDLTWVDALVDVAARSLGAVTSPQRADLYRTYLHIDADRHWLNGGVALPSTLAEHLTCDSRFHLLYEKDGRPISIGHAQQIVPNHTRRVVLDRDRACRLPAATPPGTCRSIISCTGPTTAPATPGTWRRCARSIIEHCTSASSPCTATPMSPMASCSTRTASRSASPPRPHPPARHRHRHPTTPGNTQPANDSTRGPSPSATRPVRVRIEQRTHPRARQTPDPGHLPVGGWSWRSTVLLPPAGEWGQTLTRLASSWQSA